MGFTDIIFIIILITLSYFTIFHLLLWFEIKGNIRRKIKNKNLHNVTILIPAYNEEKVIEKTLRRILSIDYPKNKMEILVIDDGSTDRTYEIAKKFESKNLKVIRKKNTGKASSLNFALNYVKHDFVAVMDADSFLSRDALKRCMSYFDEKEVAAVTAHILVKHRKTLWEKLQHTEHMIVALMRKAQEKENIISVTPGPLSVYRTDVLKKLGGFDEKNLVEDVEIAWRLIKHGYKIRMAFDAMVYSIYPDTFSRWWKQRRRWIIGGLQTFFKYFSSLFDRKAHGVGTFLMPVSLIGYVFALVGTSLFGYLIFTKIFNNIIYYITAFSAGTNPFTRFEFTYNIDLLFIYGFIMFLISLFVIRLSLNVHKDRPSLWILALFLTIYPMLLTVNFLISIYKFVRMERGWLTK